MPTCPRADGDLVRQRVRGRDTELDRCSRCHGVWFDDGQIAEIIGARAVDPLPIPPGAARMESIRCPRCSEALRRFSYPGTATVIDSCASCAGVWLDAGELEEIWRMRARSQMTCPVCSATQAESETCARCGVVIARARSRQQTVRPTPPARERGSVKQALIGFIDEWLPRLWASIRQ